MRHKAHCLLSMTKSSSCAKKWRFVMNINSSICHLEHALVVVCIAYSTDALCCREPTDKAADTQEWEQDLEEEVEEVKREVNEEHKATMTTYREKMEVWKTQRARKVCY